MSATTKPNTAFDDMESDTPWGDAAPTGPTQLTDAMCTPRLAASAKTHATFTEKCVKCGGSGRYRAPSSWGTQCFACKGAGFKAFKTSAEARAKVREQEADRKERARQASIVAFAETYPEAHAWMTAKAPTFDFARSMLDALGKWGALTAGQLAAVERCAAQDRTRAAEKAAAQVAAPAPAPEKRLNALHTVLQRHAKFYAGELTISRRNADQLCWIKHADAEKVVGKIDNGVLTLWNRPGVDLGTVKAMLDEFEGAPLQTAMKYGKLAGRCCSCGRELTNDGSIEAGIGPICAGKF